MFKVSGEKLRPFLDVDLSDKKFNIDEIDVDSFAYIRFSMKEYNHLVQVPSLSIPGKVISKVVHPLTDGQEDIGSSILFEFQDIYQKDYADFIVKALYSKFIELNLSSLELTGVKMYPPFSFESCYCEFEPYSVMFYRLNLADSVIPRMEAFDYKPSELLGTVVIPDEFDLSGHFGSNAMKKREVGDVRGILNRMNEFYDTFSRAVVVTDSFENPYYKNIVEYDKNTQKKASIVYHTIIVDDEFDGENLNDIILSIKQSVSPADIVIVTPFVNTPKFTESRYMMLTLRHMLFYLLVSEMFKVFIVMESRFDPHVKQELTTAAERTHTMIFGPSECGILSPGKFSTGNIKCSSDIRGNVAVITRDVGIMNQVIDTIGNNSHGIYEAIAIGTSNHGMSSSFSDNIFRFSQYNKVHMIVVIESSNNRPPNNDIDHIIALQEEDVINKPVVAWFSNKEDNARLAKHGVFVPPSLDQLGEFINKLYASVDKELTKSVHEGMQFLEHQFSAMGMSTEDYDDDGDETELKKIKDIITQCS